MQEMLPSSWSPYVNSCSILHVCPESGKELLQKGALSTGMHTEA